jgi:hypothetical protein
MAALAALAAITALTAGRSRTIGAELDVRHWS